MRASSVMGFADIPRGGNIDVEKDRQMVALALFDFQTTNALVEPIHPKAMPVFPKTAEGVDLMAAQRNEGQTYSLDSSERRCSSS
jgi:hypothetical protein